MKTPSQEDLLGYVLGALDAQEQREIQQHIDQNPELEEQLLSLRTSMLPLDCLDTSGPRPGLARRTCEMVANHQSNFVPDASAESWDADEDYEDDKVVLSEPRENRFLSVSSWSVSDFAAGIALMAIMAGILFPAVSYTRYNSRLMACQNNLRQIGNALMRFSDSNCGCFVEIPSSGPLAVSGCVAPILKDSGFIEDDDLFACAGLGSEGRPVNIPTMDVIMSAEGRDLCRLKRSMSGNYGYTIGHCVDQRYCPPQNLGRTHVVLMADMPSLKLPGRVSFNHCQKGQNCLFEDGHVAFIAGDSIGEDPIFFNDYNLVAPGVRLEDNVIAPSHLGRCQDLATLNGNTDQ